MELVFQSVDKLTGMIECLKDPSAETVDCDSVLAEIQHVLQDAGVEREQVSQEDAKRIFESAKETSTPSDTTTPQPNTASQPNTSVDHFAEIHDETEVSAKYLSIFIDESEETLDSVVETLLAEQGEKNLQAIVSPDPRNW